MFPEHISQGKEDSMSRGKGTLNPYAVPITLVLKPCSKMRNISEAINGILDLFHLT